MDECKPLPPGDEAGLKNVTLEIEVGPARYHSPYHTMPCKSITTS
jgi:hypothetical protein